jgi:proliferating cell nuclear antigen
MTLSISTQTDTLASFVNAAHALVDEAKIRATDDGLAITAVDPANVGMIDESLAADAFASYSVESDTVLGVTLGRLADILSMADGDDVWHIHEQDRKIIMQSGGLEYSMATIDPDSIRSEPDIPDLDLPVTAHIEWGRVARALRAADMVSDHVSLASPDGSEGLVVKAEGDTDDVREEIPADALGADSDVPAGEAVESLFSLDYLNDMKGPIPGDETVTLRLGSEMPLKMHWGSGDMSVTNMLAPRIQS